MLPNENPMLFRLLSWLALSVAACLGVATVPAQAAMPDASDPVPDAVESDPLAAARALAARQNWAEAITELKRVNQPGSADWNSLMGYTHRKMKTPDLKAAERYYDAALRIDPTHRGALEYSGELFLMLGDLGRAEQRLAGLDRVCPRSCEEQKDLKKAIEAYKAGGKRPAAKSW
jgi:tetratricopeptide (TPR) repeat protein